MNAYKRATIRYLSLFLILFLFSCAPKSEQSERLSGTYPLHPSFEPFYQRLGGMSRLGPAISPPIEQGGKRYQYTTAVLLEYDLKSGQVQLSPLGKELGLYSFSPSQVTDSGSRVNNLRIYPLFQKTYDEMGGEEVIGQPISEVHYNNQLGRYEQYFERAGFYLLEGDVSQTVYLLSYGAWKCRQSCSFSTPENSRVDLPVTIAEPILAFIYRHGIEFSGFALSEPYIAEDGLVEQIYENVVLTFNPEHPEQVNLRPLPQLVGVPSDPMEAPYSLPDHVWVNVEQEMGFQVPNRFWDYLQAHGGLDLSGNPQTKVHNLSEGRQRQCFVKFCLEDQIDLFGERVVRLSKLGEEYRKLKSQLLGMTNKSIEASQIILRAWESQPIVPPDREQEIGVSVYAGDQPVSGISPEIIITYPGGREERLNMPTTDREGKSQLRLAPIQAENGTLIPYRVCIQDVREQKYCVRDSFLIWKAEELARPHVQYLPAIFQWLEKTYQIFLPILMR